MQRSETYIVLCRKLYISSGHSVKGLVSCKASDYDGYYYEEDYYKCMELTNGVLNVVVT